MLLPQLCMDASARSLGFPEDVVQARGVSRATRGTGIAWGRLDLAARIHTTGARHRLQLGRHAYDACALSVWGCRNPESGSAEPIGSGTPAKQTIAQPACSSSTTTKDGSTMARQTIARARATRYAYILAGFSLLCRLDLISRCIDMVVCHIHLTLLCTTSGGTAERG